MSRQRDSYWDIVKGIGIVSIVIGHVGGVLYPYVYMYHLVIFFFVGGYFYNGQKYAEDPYGHLGRVIKSTYPKYVFYTWLLILLNNFCVKCQLSTEMELYSFGDMVKNACNALVLQNSEHFGGALWFVPVYLFLMGLLGFVVHASRITASMFAERFPQMDGKTVENAVLFLLTAAIGYIGVRSNQRGVSLTYHIHTAFVVFPVSVAAYLLQRRGTDIKRYAKAAISLPLLFILYLFVAVCEFRIELSAEQIVNGCLFYVISAVGIAFCLCLANLIEKWKPLACIFAILGRYSFSVMAMHFLVFKLIDRLYALGIGETDAAIYAAGITAFPQLRPLYVLVASALPACLAYGFHAITDKRKSALINP